MPDNPADVAGNTMRALGDAGHIEAAPASSTPASSPPPETPTQEAPVQAPVVAQTPAPEPPAPEYTSLLDYAKTELGQELPFKDDAAAFRALVDGWRQAQQVAPFQPHIAEYLNNQQQYNAWKQEQARREQPKPASLWNPPAAREDVQRWMASHYERDETGNIRAKADCPLDVRQKVEAYSAFINDWNTKLQHDPMAALQPFVQQMVQPILEQQQARTSEDYQAKQTLEKHASWLYEGTDRNQLSQAGKVYAHFVKEAEELGVRGVTNIDKYAANSTWTYLTQQQAQAAPAASPAAAVPAVKPMTRNEQFTMQNNRRPQVGAAVANGQAPPSSNKNLSLGERMRNALKEAGVDAGKEEAVELGLS